MDDKGQEALNALIAMNTRDPETMSAIAAELADFAGIEDPTTWTPAALLQALRNAKDQRRTDVVNRRIDLAGINWQTEQETFLNYTLSIHTRRAYTAALRNLETWAGKKGLNPLELNAASADQFIHDMKAHGRAPASTRRDIAAVSAFYTFLERNTGGKIKNPIRGTRQRPPKENKKEIVIPLPAEYALILASIPSIERAIVETLATRGLRAGALPTLELKGKKYHGRSKGKALKENGKEGITLPQESLTAIEAAGLDLKKPFAWKTRQGTSMNANALERRINSHMGKLYQAGKIRAAFSCHDFRHFFAVNEYKKTKDIYRVSMLLNHENIGITVTYLKSLDVEL
jgi:site-specific recombinase XerD